MRAISASYWEFDSLACVRVDQTDFLLLGRNVLISLSEKLQSLMFLEYPFILCNVQNLTGLQLFHTVNRNKIDSSFFILILIDNYLPFQSGDAKS